MKNSGKNQGSWGLITKVYLAVKVFEETIIKETLICFPLISRVRELGLQVRAAGSYFLNSG